eukprot:193056-Prymnesium_polylepis.1
MLPLPQKSPPFSRIFCTCAGALGPFLRFARGGSNPMLRISDGASPPPTVRWKCSAGAHAASPGSSTTSTFGTEPVLRPATCNCVSPDTEYINVSTCENDDKGKPRGKPCSFGFFRVAAASRRGKTGLGCGAFASEAGHARTTSVCQPNELAPGAAVRMTTSFGMRPTTPSTRRKRFSMSAWANVLDHFKRTSTHEVSVPSARSKSLTGSSISVARPRAILSRAGGTGKGRPADQRNDAARSGCFRKLASHAHRIGANPLLQPNPTDLVQRSETHSLALARRRVRGSQLRESLAGVDADALLRGRRHRSLLVRRCGQEAEMEKDVTDARRGRHRVRWMWLSHPGHEAADPREPTHP